MSVDLTRLLDKALETLSREVTNLCIASASRKLSPTEARDLAAYVKLLKDLDKEARDREADMSEEEIRAILTKATGSAPSPQSGSGK